MTVQQLKYILKVAEVGSITEAAKLLFISQPSLSNSIKETEKEAGITIFLRSRIGITLTKDGAEFLGYARQVIQQMELLEDRYVTNLPGKVTFGVSSQHYTFTENAFVELVKRFGQERYAFYYNETGTYLGNVKIIAALRAILINKFKFVTKVFAMKEIKIELLGIAIIPLGIAVTTNNFWGYVLGVLGFGVAVVGCFLKDNH